MRIDKNAVFGAVLFAVSTVAVAEDCTAIAYVNISQVMQQVGYDRLYLLDTDPEIRKELGKLAKQREALTRELIAAKDQEGLKEITERIRLLETKHSMLAKNSRRSASRQAQNAIKTFVAETYGKRYGLIMTRRPEDDSNVIQQSVPIENLTDKVAADLSAALDSLSND